MIKVAAAMLIKDGRIRFCPNCHRKMHALDLAADREKLKREING